MPMEEDLIARLGGNAGIAAAVGVDDGAVPSISWGARPRAAPGPWLVLTKISAGREYTHEGPDGLDGPRVQFDCLAATDAEAAALSRAVRACMESTATVGDTKFHFGFLEAENWIDESEEDGGEPLARISQDYTFYHEEI